MQSTDDFYRKLIKPIRDDRVSSIISSVDSSIFSPYDQQLNWSERISPIKRLREDFTSWSQNLITGLDRFPFMYITNGNTDSLNRLFSTATNLSCKQGDYSYYSHWHAANKKKIHELETPQAGDDFIFSWPGYSQGDNTELEFATATNSKRLHLDCAYLGLTKPGVCLDISQFETASFSFSKSLAIPYNRIGVLFSKKELADISLLNKLGYVNLSGVKLATHIMKNLPAEYWWNTYGDKINKLCDSNNLTATDSILFAYENDKRIGLAPYWNKQ